MLNCKAPLLLLMGIQVKLGAGLVVWLGVMGRGWINSVIIDITTEMNYKCN